MRYNTLSAIPDNRGFSLVSPQRNMRFAAKHQGVVAKMQQVPASHIGGERKDHMSWVDTLKGGIGNVAKIIGQVADVAGPIAATVAALL